MLARTIIYLTIINTLKIVHGLDISDVVDAFTFDVPEDARLGIIELVEKYGHHCERHDVITEDGYILGLFHIISRTKSPTNVCLLYHGIFDSADTWVIRGNLSLGIRLADRGYDVWLGNMRGNKYSRKHIIYDPDRDREFWRFGLDEFGSKDLPAIIDFILNKTSQSQLSAIGHSEGTTSFYVLGTTRPEYNSIVKIFISLAPIKIVNHTVGLGALVLKVGPKLNVALDAKHVDELLPNRTAIRPLLEFICSNGVVSTVLCEFGVLGPLVGYDSKEYNDFLSIGFGHYPAGTSRQNLNQFIQDYQQQKLTMYDYGPKENLRKYNSTEPPVYDFSNVTMKVALLVGENDFLSTIPDVQYLRNELPNVVLYKIIDHRKMDHVDFIWGKHMYQYLFPIVFDLLDTYN